MPLQGATPTMAGMTAATPTPRPTCLTKFVSLDGLVGWENRAYDRHQDVIYRTCVLPLSAAVRPLGEMSDPLASTQVYRRTYHFNGQSFDRDRGVFVNEYRERYEGR